MKVYVMTDLEGVAGVLSGRTCIKPGDTFYERAVRLTTMETNAAIEGLFAGGATEIVVSDGHGWGAIDPELLDSRATLIAGGYRDRRFGLDSSFDGLCYVGQHAKAGTPFSHLTHTGSHSVIDQKLNGLSIGEYGEFVLTASEMGVRVFLACGENALCEEALQLTPWIHTVPVKWGLMPDGLDHVSEEDYAASKQSALHLSPTEARARIRTGAEAATRDLRKHPERFELLKLPPPYVLEMWLRASAKRESPAKYGVRRHSTSISGAFEAELQFRDIAV